MNTDSLLLEMEKLCHDLAYDRKANADLLFELTKKGEHPESLRQLAESFGLMLVKVESREYHLEQIIDDLQKTQTELEQAREQLIKKNSTLKKGLRTKYAPNRILGRSPQLKALLDQVERIADTPVNVLICGETGTGKELIAKTLHFNSLRCDGPFMAVNCSAIPETLFESEFFGIEKGVATGVTKRIGMMERAEGGTLFLDEIGDMPLTCQAKILRILEDRQLYRVGSTQPIPIEIRVLAATHKDLEAEVKAGKFREDLYYRLKVVQLTIPPLRERRVDIELLCKARIEEHCKAMNRPLMTFLPATMEILKAYDWNGNVRELDNEMERIVALAYSQEIQPDDLSEHIAACVRGDECPEPVLNSGHVVDTGSQFNDLPFDLASLERMQLERALLAAGDNKTEAAKLLGISREGLRKKMKRFALE